MRARRRRDLVAIGVIWSCVLVGALLLAPFATDDPAGVGQLAALVGFALTGLYFSARSLRHPGRLLWTPADPGSAAVSWLKAVLGILLWLAGSAIGLAAGMHDALALCFGGLFPLAVFLGRRRRDARRKWRAITSPLRGRSSPGPR
jgi:hypothetical protein